MRVKTGKYTAGIFLYVCLDILAMFGCVKLMGRKDQGGTNILNLNAAQIRRLALKNTGALDADDQACEDREIAKQDHL